MRDKKSDACMRGRRVCVRVFMRTLQHMSGGFCFRRIGKGIGRGSGNEEDEEAAEAMGRLCCTGADLDLGGNRAKASGNQEGRSA